MFIALIVFLPTLLKERGYPYWVGATAHFLFVAAGCVGMLSVGALGRLNRRWVQTSSLLGGIPFVLAFLYPQFPLPLALVFLSIAGFFTLSTNSMHIVMGQELSYRHASTLTSLMMGVGWAAAALGPFLVGILSEPLGLTKAMAVVVTLPLVSLPLVMFLRPHPKPSTAVEGADASGLAAETFL